MTGIHCPDPACREDLKRDFNCKLSKCVKSSTLYATLVIVVAIISAILGVTYSAYSGGQKKQNLTIEANSNKQEKCSKDVNQVKISIEIIKNDLKHLQRQADKSEETQKEMLDILRTLHNGNER